MRPVMLPVVCCALAVVANATSSAKAARVILFIKLASVCLMSINWKPILSAIAGPEIQRSNIHRNRLNLESLEESLSQRSASLLQSVGFCTGLHPVDRTTGDGLWDRCLPCFL